MLRFLWLLLVGLSCVGCQHSELAPVSGRITLDGRPLGNVAVTFQPLRTEQTEPVAANVGSSGITDAQGQYSLRCLDKDQPGAAVGAHKVYIGGTGKSINDVAPVSKLALPSKCSDGSLTIEVPKAGTSRANFDLKSSGG